VREGACFGAATRLHPWTLRLILNAAALAAASPTLLLSDRFCCEGSPVHGSAGGTVCVCVCLLLQDLVQSCWRGVCVYYCRT
jgi:hypothetical protein